MESSFCSHADYQFVYNNIKPLVTSTRAPDARALIMTASDDALHGRGSDHVRLSPSHVLCIIQGIISIEADYIASKVRLAIRIKVVTVVMLRVMVYFSVGPHAH